MSLDIRHIWSLILTLLLFAGLLFSAGGGLHPGDEAGGFIYFKLTFFFLPYATIAMIALRSPRRSMNIVTDILAENKTFLIYLAAYLFSIPLAVSTGYSFNRLIYTIYGTGSLLALAAVYFSWIPNAEMRLKILCRHLGLVSLLSLLPLIFITVTQFSGSVIPGIRDSFEQNLPIHPNVISAFYALLFIWQIARGNKIIAFLLGVAILILFSRTVLFCLVGSVAVFSILSFFWYGRRSAFAFAFLGLGCAFGVLGLALSGILPMNGVLEPILRGSSVEEFATLTNRTVLWQELINQIDLKITFLGNGYAVMNRDFSVDFGTGFLYGAHNTYLSVFLGGGIFTLLAYLCYLTSSYLKIRSLRRVEAQGVVLALACSLFFIFMNGFLEELTGHNTSPALGYLIFMMTMFGTRVRA